jgi:hypothetical protein
MSILWRFRLSVVAFSVLSAMITVVLPAYCEEDVIRGTAGRGTLAAGIPSRMGGGNIMLGRDLQQAERQFRALRAAGVGMCRFPVGKDDYWAQPEGQPRPERHDALVLAAHRHGVRPIILFEFYTRWHGEIGDHEQWRRVGRAYAQRFGPNSSFLKEHGIQDWGIDFFTAVNEPMWRDNNPTPIAPEAYAAALEGLADGVHEVDPKLRVSPGGYIEGFLFQNKNPYIKAVAPLFNSGKLYAVGIHRYWDVDWVPMQGTYRFSLQNQFDQVKRSAGISADVRFYTDEVNFKKRKVTEEQAAVGFLTALWDALAVVGDQGQPVAEFVFPWNIFHTTERDEHYGLCTQLDPWTPTARGEVLRLVARLTQGLDFVALDPRDRGQLILEGGGRRLWVWQNRPHWTDRPGSNYTIADLPADARRLEIYGWDGLRRSIDLAGQRSWTLDGLAENETLMFLATP